MSSIDVTFGVPPSTYGNGRSWPQRHPLELLGRTAIVHLVFILNYIHLQRTQKISYSNRTAHILRLVLLLSMPTVVLAELFLSLCRTFALFVLSDPSKLTPQDVIKYGKRYICAAAGMYVVPQPGFAPSDDVQTADLEIAEEIPPETATSTTPRRSSPLRLCGIRDSTDLQEHKHDWTWQAVGHILVLFLPVLQAVGTIILWVRRTENYNLDVSDLDRRNFVAAISSIACSAAAAIILLCRSEWSLNILNSSPKADESLLGNFWLELVLGSIVNEAPFAHFYWAIPFSWIDIVWDALRPVGVIIITSLLLLAWFLIWMFNDNIKQKVTINWHLVLAMPMTALAIWIFVDLVAYFIFDIAQLVNPWYSDVWNADSWAKYLPIC